MPNHVERVEPHHVGRHVVLTISGTTDPYGNYFEQSFQFRDEKLDELQAVVAAAIKKRDGKEQA